MTFVKDSRVVAAAKAIAAVDSGRSKVKTPTGKPSACDFHEAIVAVKAIDEVSPSAVAAVLALHAPVRRYQAASRLDRLTYPTVERALEVNRGHSMRGFESLVLTSPEDVPFVEVCGECSRVENAFDHDQSDDHDDQQDGTVLSMLVSAWPCATYTALTGGDSR